MARWEFDGITCWGETHDFYPFAVHRRLHRRLPLTHGL
jgi:hypothetical protein